MGSASRVLAAVGVGMALVLAAVPASAKDSPKCKVLTIHATNKEGASAPALEGIPELKKEPFSLYKTFHLLAEKEYAMVQDVPVQLSLPASSGLSAKLIWKGMNPALKELNFKLSLVKGTGKDQKEEVTSFAVHGKAPFFYVRPFKEGKLILYIRCGTGSD